VTTWRCPVCRGALERRELAWVCAQAHSFDVAREGYVNLLITHQRRQREPGDSADMVSARRAFLDTGAYAPLRDAIAEQLGAVTSGNVVDVGCGEGYYTRDLDATVWGIDIARPAVRLAAQREKQHHYAVASAFDLPLADESVDALVSVFAPLHTPEYDRVLRPGGVAVVVTPAPDHLRELAGILFERVEPHPAEPPFARPDARTDRVNYGFTTEKPGALLRMTPWSWYVSPAQRDEVDALESLTATADFLVTTYFR
jgi:23S rRNA (guanine745-N1)-methyltransferase